MLIVIRKIEGCSQILPAALISGVRRLLESERMNTGL
jgi:hypothetical protein